MVVTVSVSFMLTWPSGIWCVLFPCHCALYSITVLHSRALNASAVLLGLSGREF